ncbi:EH domain-binding protein 1-like protein [Aix galericulata]|nr:EH domain-binding protein 1-like protein [Aix galericulata]
MERVEVKLNLLHKQISEREEGANTEQPTEATVLRPAQKLSFTCGSSSGYLRFGRGDLDVNCRQPDKLVVVWTRRSRRKSSKHRLLGKQPALRENSNRAARETARLAHSWQPGIKNPYRGVVVWPVPENVEITVTLFKDPHAEEFEDKEWTFVIENAKVRLSRANNVQAQDLGVAEPGGNRSSQIRPQTEKSGIFQESEQRDQAHSSP